MGIRGVDGCFPLRFGAVQIEKNTLVIHDHLPDKVHRFIGVTVVVNVTVGGEDALRQLGNFRAGSRRSV